MGSIKEDKFTWREIGEYGIALMLVVYVISIFELIRSMI